MKRINLRGDPTWILYFDYGWFRYGQWILRCRYLLIWPEYIGKKKVQ